MIEILQTKSRVSCTRTLQMILWHIFIGLTLFTLQVDFFGSGLTFIFITFWLCFPFFNELKKDIGLCTLSIGLCYTLNLIHPIFALFGFYSFQFLESNDKKLVLTARAIVLIISSLFLQIIFSLEQYSGNYLLLSTLVSVMCYLDVILITCFRESLNYLVNFNIHNFLRENMSLEKDYFRVLNSLEQANFFNSLEEERQFLSRSYNLNFKLFLLSIVKLWSKDVEVFERYEAVFKEIEYIRNQLKYILEKSSLIKTKETLLNLDEVKQLFVELHQFYEDYEKEVKALL